MFAISWIFWSKNECLVFLTVFLNCFQLAKLLDNLYFSKSLLQLMSYQLFKYFEILTILEFLSQALSTIQASRSTMFSNDLMLNRLEMLMDEIFLIKSLMNNISSSLPLVIECFQSLESCCSIGMVTVRKAWSDNNLHSGWMVWLSNSTELYLRNMRSMMLQT